MAACKRPNYETGVGRYSKTWSASLRKAQEAGAVIIVEETGETVFWVKNEHPGFRTRPWIDRRGNRYDSRECVPVF